MTVLYVEQDDANYVLLSQSVSDALRQPTLPSFGPLFATNMGTNTVGAGLQIKPGTNAKIGSATLSTGAVTVANTSVTANSKIFIDRQGTSLLNIGALSITSVTAGTGFTIGSSNILDSSTVNYLIVEAA